MQPPYDRCYGGEDPDSPGDESVFGGVCEPCIRLCYGLSLCVCAVSLSLCECVCVYVCMCVCVYVCVCVYGCLVCVTSFVLRECSVFSVVLVGRA